MDTKRAAEPRAPGLAVPTGLSVCAAAALVAAATAASRLAAFSGDVFSLFWPAAGIGFVLMVFWRRHGLIALASGMMFWALIAYRHTPLLVPFAVAASCTGPALTAALLGPRFRAAENPFGSLKTMLDFLRTEAFVAVPAGALVGCLGLWSVNHAAVGQLPAIFVCYWIIELCGAVTFAPVTWRLFSHAGQVDLKGFVKAVKEAIGLDHTALLGIGAVALVGLLMMRIGEAEYARAVLYLLLPILAINAASTRPFAAQFTLLVAAVAVLTTRAYALHNGLTAGGSNDLELFASALYLVLCACTALVISTMSDEMRRAKERIEEQAFSDPLTGLLNEAGLRRLLLSTTQGQERHITLVRVRLVNRSAIEQLFGGEVAVKVVREAGLALTQLLATVTWSRVSSTRFIGVLASPSHLDSILSAALAIVGQISSESLDSTCRPVWSVRGVRALTDEQLDADALLAALSAPEGQANDRKVRVVEVDGRVAALQRDEARSAERVREAIAHRRVVLYGQAIVANHNPHGRKRPSLEVLVKLRDAAGEDIDACAWLPIAARHGWMDTLDLVVLEATLDWFAKHRIMLERFEYCGINLSGPSVNDPELAHSISALFDRFDLPADKFMFEITENQTIANPAGAAQMVRALRTLGSKVAIDDFGTGMATFDYLKRFEVDCIKIDGSFIRDLADNPVDEAIVRSIVTVAKACSVRTVAEYVTSEALLKLVGHLAIDASQGYAVGMPTLLEHYFEAPAWDQTEAPVTRLKLAS